VDLELVADLLGKLALSVPEEGFLLRKLAVESLAQPVVSRRGGRS